MVLRLVPEASTATITLEHVKRSYLEAAFSRLSRGFLQSLGN